MYGLILEGMADHIRQTYGEEKWKLIRQKANINEESFSTHQMYNDKILPQLSSACQHVLQESPEKIFDAFGAYFVSFIGQYGYDTMLKVLGRNLRDFLDGLDNLHEYLKFSYPRLKAPSFRIENETEKGLVLHYRSKRKGFIHYVKGQIKKVGEIFYGQTIEIEVLTSQENSKSTHVVLQLYFDNSGYNEGSSGRSRRGIQNLQVNSDFFLECFPFHVVFDKTMTIRHIGHSIANVMPNLIGQRMESTFTMNRPVMDFNYQNIVMFQNIMFEVTTIKEIGRKMSTMSSRSSSKSSILSKDDEDNSTRMRMKGQMLHIPSWDAVIFLATPIVESLDKMFDLGVYITDLSMHDVSRDLILVGAQQSRELTQALAREQTKSKKLGDMMKRLDELKKRGDELLYSMIPSSVAAKMQGGESMLDLCQPYEAVTIMFSDVPGFTELTGKMKPIDVMGLLNQLFSKIDNLIERHKVYKVETIGDVYMVAAGAPDPNKEHAIFMTNLALDMIRCVKDIRDPTTKDDHVKIRIGVHSGPVVTGIVGLKMPRFCFFGDTVNTSARMESHGEPMKIHISVFTKSCLVGKPYKLERRGTIPVKGKGDMDTYWLLGRTTDGTTVSPTKVKMPELNIPKENTTMLPPISNKAEQEKVLDSSPKAITSTTTSSKTNEKASGDKLPPIGEKSTTAPSYGMNNKATPTAKENAEIKSQGKSNLKPTPPQNLKSKLPNSSIGNDVSSKNVANSNVNTKASNDDVIRPTPPTQPKPDTVRPLVGRGKTTTQQAQETDDIKSTMLNGNLAGQDKSSSVINGNINEKKSDIVDNGSISDVKSHIMNGNDVTLKNGVTGFMYTKPKSRLCSIL